LLWATGIEGEGVVSGLVEVAPADRPTSEVTANCERSSF